MQSEREVGRHNVLQRNSKETMQCISYDKVGMEGYLRTSYLDLQRTRESFV
jgi:hypothetical protein